jgi:hypothetical protein
VSDAEWEQLVAQLRETFEAKGVIKYDGPFRQWSNGNLHVLLEPTPDGHRIRFRTTNGLSRSFITGGLGLAGIGGLVTALNLLAGVNVGINDTMMLVSLGLGSIAFGALRLPSWAEKRRRQMEALAKRLAAGSGRSVSQTVNDRAIGRGD